MWLLCWYMIKNQRTFYYSFVSPWNMFMYIYVQSGVMKTSDKKVFPNFKMRSAHSSQDSLSDTSVHPVSIGLCAFCLCCLQSAGHLGRLNSYSYQNASLPFVAAVFVWHYFYSNTTGFFEKCLTFRLEKNHCSMELPVWLLFCVKMLAYMFQRSQYKWRSAIGLLIRKLVDQSTKGKNKGSRR